MITLKQGIWLLIGIILITADISRFNSMDVIGYIILGYTFYKISKNEN